MIRLIFQCMMHQTKKTLSNVIAIRRLDWFPIVWRTNYKDLIQMDHSEEYVTNVTDRYTALILNSVALSTGVFPSALCDAAVTPIYWRNHHSIKTIWKTVARSRTLSSLAKLLRKLFLVNWNPTLMLMALQSPFSLRTGPVMAQKRHFCVYRTFNQLWPMTCKPIFHIVYV